MSQDPADNPKKAFPLRLDARLYAELRRWADAELRSMNGQIEFILRRALADRRRALGGDEDAAPEDRRE